MNTSVSTCITFQHTHVALFSETTHGFALTVLFYFVTKFGMGFY
jgi:hypothetical protein